MESFLRYTTVIFALCLPIFVFCLPANKNQQHLKVSPSIEEINFMEKYGYLGVDPTLGMKAQYKEDYVIEAIKNIQKFGGLEQTGVFDNKTKELIRKPRCGVKDIIRGSRHKRYAIVGKGWRKRELTYFVANWNQNLGEYIVRDNIKKALNMWGQYGQLTFTPSNDPSSDIKIAFGVGNHGDLYPFDGRGLVLAHAFFPYVRDGGSVHFDNDELWTFNSTSPDEEGTDFFSVAVHEIGHALGLAHSEVPESIMFAYYKGSPLQLHNDDVMAMYELYIKRFDAIDTNSINNVDESHETDHTEEPSSTETYSTTKRPSSTEYYTEHITKKSTADKPKTTYDGDYESVDDHKKHDDKHGIPRSYDNTSELCMGKYDTIAVLRGELYVFKDTTVWRFRRKGVLYDGYPTSLFNMFPNLPSEIKRIDAAYENTNNDITFFSGTHYWIYDLRNYNTYNIEDYAVYNSPTLNAVMRWPVNNKTYLFGRDRFWRYNEGNHTLDDGYPKHMRRWRGIPDDIDAAIFWIDESTYFFKGLFYWKFNSDYMAADMQYPLPVPQRWFGCKETPEVFQELRRLRKLRNQVKIRN